LNRKENVGAIVGGGGIGSILHKKLKDENVPSFERCCKQYHLVKNYRKALMQ